VTTVSQTFSLDKGKTFLAGLFWHALSASDPRGEARQIAKQQAFQFAVFRQVAGKIVQAGFGSAKSGHRQGMCSAAAVVTKTIELELGLLDFIVAAKIPDNRYLYVVQRDGAIHPDGDFIGTEDEVQVRLLQDQTLGEWSYIAAPAHWGIPKSEERSFESFLPRKPSGRTDYHRWWELAPIKHSMIKYLLTLVAVGGIVAAPVMGWRWYQERQAIEAAAQQAALDAANGSPNAPRPEHPWKKMPRATPFVAACMTGLDKIPSLVPGNWTVGEIVCNGTSVAIGWRRKDTGWIEHLRQIAPEVTTSPDGQSASLSVPVTMPATESDEALQDERQRGLAMHAVAQIYRFTSLNLTPAVSPAPAALPGQPANTPQTAPPPPEWKEIKWAIMGSPMSPSIVAAALDAPGFRMTSIKAIFNGGSLSWSMEGIQYVSP
jgi:hypothetical protein